MTGLLNPKPSEMPRDAIEVLRNTVLWRECFLNDGAPQPKIVGNAACYGIEVLRYTVFWRECFPNDGGSLTQNRRKCRVLRYRGTKVYRLLAGMFFE